MSVGSSEDEIREAIVGQLRMDRRQLLGYGDDAVAYEIDADTLLVIHTDVFVASTDLLPGMSLYEAGRKAVVMNVSDIVSKGAKPFTILFSWGIPRGMELSKIRQITRGLDSASHDYGLRLSGGDTSESTELFLAGTALGFVGRRQLLTRRTAHPGDIVAATGVFGLTSIAFKVLLEEEHAGDEISRRAIKAAYRPKARLKEALALAKSGTVTASMDSSDGFARSLHWLSRMSGVGFQISRVPIAQEAIEFAEMHGIDPYCLAMYEGGEEYELIVCVKRKGWKKAVEAVRAVGGRLYRLGSATEGREIVLRHPSRRDTRIENIGWQHFQRWSAERRGTLSGE